MNKATRNLLIFFAATLGATYVCYFSIVLAGWNPFSFPGLILFLIGGSAPSWVALLLVLLTYNREERQAYFQRLAPRLISARWWMTILLIFPVVYALAYAINLLLCGTMPGMVGLKDYISQPAMLPLGLLIGFGSGPIAEEFGWRGLALDPLMQRFGRIPGTVILGLIWGVWHLGLFFMPQTWHGQLGFRFAGFFTFVLASVGLALLMTWVHAHTHQSILAAILMHFFSNFTGNVLAPHADQVEVLRMVVMLILGLAVCLAMERSREPQRLSPAAGSRI